ncbi:MAG: hypothetical protein HY873_13775 [Chloroflexi bacterium]|nr:hypothetical protein [Chloroflexota bacterium]
MAINMTSSVGGTQTRSAVARAIALGAIVIWGLTHVVGGAALLLATVDNSREGFESVGTAASPQEIPLDPGPVAQSVLQFHSLNILLAGLGVAALAMAVARTAWPRGVTVILAIIVALDLGLVAFLVAPGYMKVTDGLWGPALLLIAVPASWLAGWRPRQL